ncbi:unnamed protein product [Didymodactylos carnosus]|uniref:Uncharacterized protein n=1 Tax=Didymodactylos carnosus TaxID=1234261 RepID=A0A814TUF6_9BILA|nr:unnamed protein product [Didymodactylos carnosus]CAF3926373.1 unnamed protein product [Didymodactylos carnosus]
MPKGSGSASNGSSHDSEEHKKSLTAYQMYCHQWKELPDEEKKKYEDMAVEQGSNGKSSNENSGSSKSMSKTGSSSKTSLKKNSEPDDQEEDTDGSEEDSDYDDDDDDDENEE